MFASKLPKLVCMRGFLTLVICIAISGCSRSDNVADQTTLKSSSASTVSPAPESLAELRQMLTVDTGSDGFLDVDQAFNVELKLSPDNQLRGKFTIADGHYLYRHKISLTISNGVSHSGFELPPGKSKTDQYFGETTVLRQSFAFSAIPSGLHDELQAAVTFQGCADKGLCYPPVTRQFRLNQDR